MPRVPTTEHEQTDEQREILEKVRKRFDASENARRIHIPRWREFYGLHRNHRKFEKAMGTASERDRDEILHEAQLEFGEELFIPYIYAVIETVTPRILMNNPRMKVKPKRGLSPEAAEAVKEMFEERQSEIDYSMKLLPIVRRGLKYGLGVGKVFWGEEQRTQTVMERTMFGMGRKPVQKPITESKGPDLEDVELEDFFWDPIAKNVKTMRYGIHRTWRDPEYVRVMVESGKWNKINLDAVKGGGSDAARREMLSARAEAAGLEGYDTKADSDLHEVWEYHDGRMVYTILDRALVVQNKPAPFTHGQCPFVIFRPTLQEGEFVGIGEVEPIVDLQYELNAMRSQRRWNATLVLQKAFIYAEGSVDPADLVIGPGRGIPVYGNPSEVITPLQFADIPASGYQEEQALKSDMEFAGGLSDTLGGGSGSSNASSETATGIQLVQAAANVRIEHKTKLLHAETLKPGAAQWLSLFKQHITDEPWLVTAETPEGHRFLEVTPEDLDLVRAILPEEDSTQPENSPQKRNDALALHNQVAADEIIDKRKAMKALLVAFDVPDAEDWIIPEQEVMNPQVAQLVGETLQTQLEGIGMDQATASQVVLQTMQQILATAGVGEPPAGETQGGPPTDPMADMAAQQQQQNGQPAPSA